MLLKDPKSFTWTSTVKTKYMKTLSLRLVFFNPLLHITPSLVMVLQFAYDKTWKWSPSYWPALFSNIKLLKAYKLVNLSSSLKHWLAFKWVWEAKSLTLLAQSCKNILLLLSSAVQLLKNHGCSYKVHHKRAKTWLNLCFIKRWFSIKNEIFR